MTTLHAIQTAIADQVSGALAGLQFNDAPLAVDVAPGWPPLKRLQSVARGNPCIAVYDRRIVRNSTRWMPFSYDPVLVPATLTTEISRRVINPGGSATITLGATVTVGDAVSALLTNNSTTPFSTDPDAFQAFTPEAQVAIGSGSDTPTTMATKLVAQINADSVLTGWGLSAAAAGPVVTIIAGAGKGPFTLASYAGNGGTETREIGRREREFQIVSWNQTEEMRRAVTDPIDVLIAQLENQFGITVPDGYLRVAYVGDYDVEDGTLQDVYRRDFHLTVEYGLTTTDSLYSVLAPEVAQYALKG